MIYCFNLDFYVFFVCGISRKTVISFSYVFLCFTAWLVNINNSGTTVFNMLATSKSYGKTWFFLSTLPTRYDYFTIFNQMIGYLVHMPFELWMM